MRDVKGYEGLYAVTSCGKVWSYRKNGFLNCGKTYNGYLKVVLVKDKKQKNFYVHRLVAETYLNNIENFTDVNHKDENKHNNCVNNLEWCTHYYNIKYSMTKIYKNAGKKQRKCVCIETGEVFKNPLEVANKLNVRYYRVTSCCRNQDNEIDGLHFKYI